ncbi:three-helix bundle dimerization domain-containing protein [Streptomyces sp. V1I6]|uniref:three-helix bundle dimerization domain-containing protein n=1 Tax=Streptomyces sp. V1I6 TaxID=3042273 RepID=UPI00359307EC
MSVLRGNRRAVRPAVPSGPGARPLAPPTRAGAPTSHGAGPPSCRPTEALGCTRSGGEDTPARGSTEVEDIRRIAERLRITYRGRRTPEQVDAAVSAAVEHLKDSKIRDFVPVLAERHARDVLDSVTGRSSSDVIGESAPADQGFGRGGERRSIRGSEPVRPPDGQ